MASFQGASSRCVLTAALRNVSREAPDLLIWYTKPPKSNGRPCRETGNAGPSPLRCAAELRSRRGTHSQLHARTLVERAAARVARCRPNRS